MSVIKNILVFVTRQIPTPIMEKLIRRLISAKTVSMKPDDGLRFLFRLDSVLYSLQGQLAKSYGGGTHTKHRHMKYHEFFINRIKANERALDVGCGTGAVSYDIAATAGALVTGIDFIEDNIKTATKIYNHQNVKYLVGDVLTDLPDERFDVVVMSNVLEHIKDRPEFLKKLINVTKASRVLIRVPLFERDWRVPLRKELGIEWRLDNTHETEYTIESFLSEMDNAGMNIKHQEIRWGEIWAEVIPKHRGEKAKS